MYTVIRFRNFIRFTPNDEAILVQPCPTFCVLDRIELAINARDRLAILDLMAQEDSYCLFWLKERATDEQIQQVKDILS